MATIKEVADLAEVSTSTVSRVLNKGSASAEVKRRVADAVEKLNYRISESARGLSGRYANIVGVIVAFISNTPISQMFEGISNRLHESGMTVMFGNSEGSEEMDLELLQMFAVQRMRGVVYTGSGITDTVCNALNGFPGSVVVAAQQHPLLRRPVALFDNYRAGREVTEYIIRAGHKNIALISGPKFDQEAGLQRKRGFVDAMNGAGLPIERSYMENAVFNIDSGFAAMKRIIERSKVIPTVVCGGSDLIAIGAMKYLQEKGFAVPDDISVFGFDNIPVGANLVPSLSSVDLDFYELGEFCADLLLRLFQREESHLVKAIFNHKIIVRESFQNLIIPQE